MLKTSHKQTKPLRAKQKQLWLHQYQIPHHLLVGARVGTVVGSCVYVIVSGQIRLAAELHLNAAFSTARTCVGRRVGVVVGSRVGLVVGWPNCSFARFVLLLFSKRGQSGRICGFKDLLAEMAICRHDAYL